MLKNVAHTPLPSVGFRSWFQFLAVSLQVTWVINLAVGCHYFLPGLQLPPQSLRGLLPILLIGERRHDGCEQFAYYCYLTASQLRFEPRPFCTWVQHANHLAVKIIECLTLRLLSNLWNIYHSTTAYLFCPTLCLHSVLGGNIFWLACCQVLVELLLYLS